MKWLQTLQQYFPKHKYAIDAKKLGDHAVLAWSNLGYWEDGQSSYPEAGQALAMRLADRLQLDANDRVLDLGCGQGASLLLWRQHYHVQQLCAVELQVECVQRIRHTLNSNIQIIQNSFLNLNSKTFSRPFDVVLCLDAAYHCDLNLFLRSTHSILNLNGRIGFHYLMLSDAFLNLNRFERLQLKMLLKAADVHLGHLQLEADLMHSIQAQGYQQIEIEDISGAVFSGFSNYYHEHLAQNVAKNLDDLKIQMTAKLCQKLFEQGIVRYAQITAIKDI